MRLLFLFYLLCLASTYDLCSSSASTSCLPCPNQCLSCSSQNLCSTCTVEYYYSSSSMSKCQSCPSNCQTCSSSTSCTQCMDPYVLNNQTCSLCVIKNAQRCSSTVAASSCQSGYYLSNSYCQNCLLNCATCSSAYDCSKCATGYYLNTSIITCNPCPLGCSACNQFTPAQCTSCNDGYLFSSSSCLLNTCQIDNCIYCSNQNVCGRCKYLYYWDGSGCTMGASVTCQMGALGPLPNGCSNSCSDFSYQGSSNNSMFSCKPYSNIYDSPVQYYQIFLYSYNHLDKLNSFQGTSQTLSISSNGEYSFTFSGTIDFGSVPNYYRVRISLKYTSSDSASLILTASTPIVGTVQKETHIISQSSTPTGLSLNSTVVHSNNIAISTNTSIGLIEIMLCFWKCSSGCTVCLNQQLCQLCDDPNFMLSYNCVANCTVYIHFMPNRTCLTSCPSGYFQTVSVDNLKYCTSCNSPCLACSNSSFCISCVNGYYYYNYNCNTVCPVGYYANSSSNTCKSCINPCKTCSSETKCLSCSQGFWNGTACSNSCPSGQFGDSINFICSNCDPSCLTCINSATTCTSCNSSLIFYNKQCLSVCPTRFFNQSNTCSLCIPPCYTCSSEILCLSCSYNYLLNSSCISQCPMGFYKNQTNLICASCLPICNTCSSSTMCTSCKSGCLFSGTCLVDCPTLQLYKKISSSSLCDCVQCVYPCNTCTNQATCLSCLQGYFYNGSCLVSCPTGYYSNTQNDTCQTCGSLFTNCLRCSSTGCNQCINTYFLLNGQCFSSCPQSYYVQNQQCSLCIAPCKTCSSSDICNSCITPYSLSQQICLIQCSSTMISIAVSGSLVCYPCTSPCLSCSIKQNNCTYCVFGYYLFNNTCLTNCSQITPLNSYYSQLSSLTCQKCSFPCQLCQTQTWCLSCKIGYLNPLTGTCSQCLLGTYSYNYTCISCPASCSICYSNIFCTACVNGYFLFNNTCISDSSICLNNGYYTSGRVCYPCLQPCSKCWVSSNNCTSCLQGYIFFSPNRCLINCPNGFYQSGFQCLSCSTECQTCISSANYCLTCNTGYYLYTLNYSCVQNCPSKTYLAGTSCSSCQYPCEDCLSQMVCVSCTTGVLVGSQCYSSCLSGYFVNPQLVCQVCTSPCSQCFQTSTNCTQCTSNYWMLNNQCVSSCPSHYFAESFSRQCLKCTGLCDECNSYVNCTKCITSYIYFFSVKNQLGQCLTTCPASYYLSNSTCLACEADCNTCQDSSGCQTCKGQLVQSNGKCLIKCPDFMYSYGGICYSCQFPCSNCTDAYTCTSCPQDYLLVGSSSCVPGPNCPSGYYLQQSLTVCNSKCTAGFYNLLNNTCSNISCGNEAFMGADMFCYLSCPSGYTANRSFYCVPCSSCDDGLCFSVTYSIIRDQLYVYISFTEYPQYAFNPQLNILPNLPYKNTNSDGVFVGGGLNKTGAKNITLLVTVRESIQKNTINFSFSNPIQTFVNPLQKSYFLLQFQGYDYYPSYLPSLSNLGVISLISALIGLFKNPFLTDYAQILFLIGLLNTHYPHNLASFLQSCSIAHFHGIIPLKQQDNLGKGKFMYLTGVGFLSNTITNWIIIGAILGFSAILFFILWIGRKNLHYSRVHQQNFQQSLTQQKKEHTTSQKCLQKIDNLLSNYKVRWLNRLIYFNYSLISLFSFVQISQFTTSDTLNMISSALSVFILPLLLIFPIILRTQKTKYTFLYLRKLLISAAVVLSVEDSIYAIGIISVCNIAAILLLLTYKMQKYRAQTRFLAIGQSLQLFTLICLSLFIMIGQGNKTNYKVMLSWLIIIGFIITLCFYIAWACFETFIAFYNSYKKIQFRQNWILNRQEQEIQSHHSQSVSQSMKDSNQNAVNPATNVETILLKQVQQDKQQPFVINSRPAPNKSGQKNRPNTKGNGDFWAYQQSQSENTQKQKQQQMPKPQLPQMLIRCINQFSDYNKSQVHE